MSKADDLAIIIIAGGRYYEFTPDDYSWLNTWWSERRAEGKLLAIMTGGAPGADNYGKHWAQAYLLMNIEVVADWRKFGKKAGPLRNQAMVDRADGIILFPGGVGTTDVATRARVKGIRIWESRSRKNANYQPPEQ
jgi:hypothetical protein